MTTLEQAPRSTRTLGRASNLLGDICSRWIPDPWVIVVFLTGVAAVLSLLLSPGGASPGKAHAILDGWGTGFWDLLTFGMQIAFMLLSGHVVATSPPARRALSWVADHAGTPRRAVVLTGLTSMVGMWIHWGIGLVAAGTLVRYLAARGTRADYRLLVAAAYLGMAGTFHAGLSSSSGLLMATPGHFAEKYFGVIPMTRTVFSPLNLTLVVITIVVWTITALLLHPRPADTVSPPRELREVRQDEGAEDGERHDCALTPAQRIEHSPWVNRTIGIAGLAYIATYVAGLDGNILAGLTLDSVNFAFLFIGVLLHGTPRSLLDSAQVGGTFAWGIILQFPFYAGILGMIVASGLSERIADFFAGIATAQTYPLFVYWYSGLLNIFVPSGGSKLAIEAPYLASAATQLGTPLDLTVIAYIWGDMSSNAIQPFWALPLLAISGLSFRDIMGFLIIFFLVTVTIGTAAFAIAPLFLV